MRLKFLSDKNRTGALMTILVLAVGSISIMGIGTTQVVMASQTGKLCIIFACGNANITGGSTSSSNGGGGGGGGGGQPTPTTGTLIVTKKLACSVCPNIDITPVDFHITVTGNNPNPDSFVASVDGTKVTLGAGDFKVDELNQRCVGDPQHVCIIHPTQGPIVFDPTFSTDCTGTISAGETKECVVTNTFLR